MTDLVTKCESQITYKSKPKPIACPMSHVHCKSCKSARVELIKVRQLTGTSRGLEQNYKALRGLAKGLQGTYMWGANCAPICQPYSL